MKNCIALLLSAALTLSAGCVLNGAKGADSTGIEPVRAGPELKGKLTFVVADSVASGEGPLEGVSVRLVTRDGRLLLLGMTDSNGTVVVEKEVLAQGLVVLFSRERFFTGAWEVSPESLRSATRRYLELARFAVA
jgi:hypothetical protein